MYKFNKKNHDSYNKFNPAYDHSVKRKSALKNSYIDHRYTSPSRYSTHHSARKSILSNSKTRNHGLKQYQSYNNADSSSSESYDDNNYRSLDNSMHYRTYDGVYENDEV